jgi:hypothetical protein
MYVHIGKAVYRDLDDEDREAIAVEGFLEDINDDHKVDRLVEELRSFGLYNDAGVLEAIVNNIAFERYTAKKNREKFM